MTGTGTGTFPGIPDIFFADKYKIGFVYAETL
jgi:hypothetical protein